MTEVAHARVLGDGAAEGQKAIEEAVDGVAIGEPAVGAGFPGGLAGGAVGFFAVARELLEGLLLAAEIDGHRAAELVIFVDELSDLDFDGNIFIAEHIDLGLPASVKHLVADGLQPWKRRARRGIFSGRQKRTA